MRRTVFIAITAAPMATMLTNTTHAEASDVDFVQLELGFALAGVGAAHCTDFALTKKWDADAATGISQAQMDEINNYSDGVAPGLFEDYSADPDGWCELVWKDNGPEGKATLPKKPETAPERLE